MLPATSPTDSGEEAYFSPHFEPCGLCGGGGRIDFMWSANCMRSSWLRLAAKSCMFRLISSCSCLLVSAICRTASLKAASSICGARHASAIRFFDSSMRLKKTSCFSLVSCIHFSNKSCLFPAKCGGGGMLKGKRSLGWSRPATKPANNRFAAKEAIRQNNRVFVFIRLWNGSNRIHPSFVYLGTSDSNFFNCHIQDYFSKQKAA